LGDTGSKMKVILGGGREKFIPRDIVDPEGHHGDRDDGKNLIETWRTEKETLGNTSYIWHRDELLDLDTSNTEYLMGLFDKSHMSWEIDEDESNPSLAQMTKAAIEVLSNDDNGYFLFVEGGNIDRAHHQNEARVAMQEALAFEEAIALADSMTSAEDTLIIVTADHSHSFVINGYADAGSDILGLGDVSDIDGLPFTTLLYANGPGYSKKDHDGQRPDPSPFFSEAHYKYDSAVPEVSSNHAGEDVILYARGPQAHLFTGNHENAFIPHALRYAACVGDGLKFCDVSK